MNCYSLLVLLALAYTGKDLLNEILTGLVKLLPMIVAASIAVTLRLIVESKKNKITILNVVMSFISALGISYLFYPVILEYVKPSLQSIVIGIIVLTGDKIVSYVIYKFKVDQFLTFIADWALNKLKAIFK